MSNAYFESVTKDDKDFSFALKILMTVKRDAYF